MHGDACVHPSTSFDRSVCACGSMHDYCDSCGRAMDCPLDDKIEGREGSDAAVTSEAAVEANLGAGPALGASDAWRFSC